MTRSSVHRPVIVLMGHFPPPVHGMAVAFEALADAFEPEAEVVRLATTPHGLTRGFGYHAVRIRRWAWAVAMLMVLRRRAKVLLLSVDAGIGMLYVIVAVMLGRLVGYRLFLQHHSYAYVSDERPLMRLLSRVSASATHLCSCEAMTEQLRERYPSLRIVRTLPLAYAVRRVGAPSDAARVGTRRLRLGHFGNLTMAKGLGLALDTLDAALAAGIDAELVLAGPLAGAEEEERLGRAVRRTDDRLRYLGPVYGPQRDAYLAGIDVLLFPSRYTHESFGLALWESLLAGTPAVAYEAGCLTQQAAGPGALVLQRDASFVESTIRYLSGFAADRARLDVARREVRQQAESAIRGSRLALNEFVEEVCAETYKPG